MFGLLLIVTMVATYLSTQLPSQMRLNEQNHVLQVENQIERLDASLRGVAAAGAIGAMVSQPLSLGSLGVPPFAPPDGSAVAPGPGGSRLSVSYNVTGAATYAPPAVGPAGGPTYASCSTQSTTTLTCSTSSTVYWNFSAPEPSYTITTSGGVYHVAVGSSNSTITLTASSSAPLYLLVEGSNDTISLTVSGSSTVVHVTLVGNYDQINFPAGSWSSSTITVLAVGNHDSISTGAMSASTAKIVVTFFGSNDSAAFGTISATSSYFNVYFNGFVPSKPSASCPVGNLAASYDTITGPSTHSGGTYNATYNDSSATSASSPPPSPWAATYGNPSISCPFYSTVALPQTSSGAVGSSFALTLRNTYAPDEIVAFDQGAVVTAEPSGHPVMLVGPDLYYSGGTLTLWIPEFVGGVGTEVGIGTAELIAQLVSLLNVTLPSSSFNLSSSVVLSVTTPYAEAWWSYLNASLPTLTKTCAPSTSVACKGSFELAGPLGTVTLTVPASSLRIQTATYSVTLS